MPPKFVRNALPVGVVLVALATVVGAASPGTRESSPPAQNFPPAAGAWLDDYGDAMDQAAAERKMLLLYFYDPAASERQTQFEQAVLTASDVAARLTAEYVVARLPIDYTMSVGGKISRVLEFDAFAELQNGAGAAVIDYAHPDEEYFGYVVSVLPFTDGKYFRFDPRHFATLLDLPAGTLTQRTMVFAVRIHPESPQSTRGRADRMLFGEALGHSLDQARRRVQGHHNWGTRFQRISGLLPGGMRAQEVVAESWPQENLVDAAVDCVASWRQSPGHWGAVRADQPHFGYDIQRGDNGIWYATGLFGNGNSE